MIARRVLQTLAFASSVLVGASPAIAVPVPASGPDDICAPLDDPCVVDQDYEIQAPGTLDFGTRAVHIVPGGSLLQSVAITCGDLIVTVGSNAVAINSQEPGNNAGSVTITSTGIVDFDGKIQARGNPGGSVQIYADGDITLRGRILNDGNPIGTSGGFTQVESFAGSVTVHEELISGATKGSGNAYESIDGGVTNLRAEGNLTVLGEIDAGGGDAGGSVCLESNSGDVKVSASVNASAGATFFYGGGGDIDIVADQNVILTGSGPTETGGTRWSTNGSGDAIVYYGATVYPGYGGNNAIYAFNGDISISDKVGFFSNGAEVAPVAPTYAGTFKAYADNGSFTMDGDFKALGYGTYGDGGSFKAYACDNLEIGDAADINTKSTYGGYFYLGTCKEGQMRIGGRLDARGKVFIKYVYGYNGSYGGPGFGGSIDLRGGDIQIDGRVLNGADDGADWFHIDTCRLNISNSGRLENTLGSPDNGQDIEITIRESMTADPGSGIFADAQGGADIEITYRDPLKPPNLLGNTQPEPVLELSPFMSGCPVCGNSEIDEDESCDDGNLTSGDGCRDDCQNEGCLAESPGYPGVPLCDDGDACTVDSCDPVASTCVNIASCEEGIACTVDSCVLGACEHVPDDSLCDDFNDCTDDICNPVTSCVHANLTGGGCEDGDLCTSTGTCDAGECIATDEVHSNKNSIKFRFRDDPASDKLSYKGELSLTDFTTLPTSTGMMIEMRGPLNQTHLSATIPSSWIEDKSGTGLKFRFRDRDQELVTGGGISQISIVKIASKNIAKIKIKASDVDLDPFDGVFRMSVSMLFGTDPAIDECLTARYIPCTPKNGKNKCKDPKK